METLAKQRDSLSRFEIRSDTWRFAIRNSTSSISFEQAETFLKRIPDILAQARVRAATGEDLVSMLAQETVHLFGTEAEIIELLSEIHQRDETKGFYRAWEQRSGALSFFDRRGSWHQDENEVSLGPPTSDAEIGVYLARLGLLLPKQAVHEEVMEATPAQENSFLAFQMDLEGSRFHFRCQPWKGNGLIESIRETALWEGREQGTLEKRTWYHALPEGPFAPGTEFPACPLAGIEVQYRSDTTLENFAIHLLSGYTKDVTQWTSFPKERPPFGWPVLDYRFKPEVEFQFGVAGRE
jgi:hypothetical protein